MVPGISELELRYLNACRKQRLLPNCSIMSSFLKVKHKRLHHEQSDLEIFIDQLVPTDFDPLVEAFNTTTLSEIDVVDVCQRSSNISLKGENVLSLLHATKEKLRIVDLINCSFWNDILGSLSAAKVGSSPWPQMLSVSKLKSHSSEDTKMFRPRQFEYHPTNPSLMVFGTLDGELLVINHESQKLVGYLPSVGTLDSIIGLCWLKKYPSKLIAGSDNGSLQLYDTCQMPSTVIDRYSSTDISRNTFDEFEQLTSVHINSTDEYFLASGFCKHVALYDISSGKRLQILKDLHQEHINVVKFAHYSPSIFATASFDRDVKMWDLRQGMKQPCFTATSLRGNVMACFSPDDHYLLTSAIDNEVKQLLAVDGRLHTEFHIAPTGSSQNYTRSYYMNGKDYIISGSCEENSVRICCAQTGRRFRDLPLESGGPGFSMFVQSLRGDPFRMFHMSILAAYLHPCTKSEIIKVNLLASSDSAEEDSYAQCLHAPSGMGS